MEIIDRSEDAFNSYFKLFKKQPTKNPESNMHFLNLIIYTLALPKQLDDESKSTILNHWNMLKDVWVKCTMQPTEDYFDSIDIIFNLIINLYSNNNIITNWYENEYKQNLLQTAHFFEDNKYTYIIKNLEFQATAYDSYYQNYYVALSL